MKFVVNGLLFIVPWTGCVNHFTSIGGNSSYVFNKTLRNLKFC